MNKQTESVCKRTPFTKLSIFGFDLNLDWELAGGLGVEASEL